MTADKAWGVDATICPGQEPGTLSAHDSALVAGFGIPLVHRGLDQVLGSVDLAHRHGGLWGRLARTAQVLLALNIRDLLALDEVKAIRVLERDGDQVLDTIDGYADTTNIIRWHSFTGRRNDITVNRPDTFAVRRRSWQ